MLIISLIFYNINLTKFWRAVLFFKRVVMKKFVIKISLSFVIITVLVLILLILRSLNEYGSVPSYRFLNGRNPITCKKADKVIEDKRYTYSFEADFNDLCSKADAELKSAGFVGNTVSIENLSGNESPYSVYCQKGKFPHGMVWVYIYSNQKYLELPDSQKDVIDEKDGWVRIEVVYYKYWLWMF